MTRMAPEDIRHLVVLGHPDPASFNATVAATYCEEIRRCGQGAVLRDLYAIGFDPLLKADERPETPGFEPARDVRHELDLVARSAAITLVYPLWFGMPPAIIKGYIDRVLGAGFMAQGIPAGARPPFLHGQRLVILSSSASTRPWLDELGQWVSLRQAFDSYLTTIFAFESCEHQHFDAIARGLKPRFIDEYLEQVRQQARKTCSELLSERHAQAQHRPATPA
ncbi:MAG: NAD(P)H-dependent oxidoreductase [Sphingomonas sp.]